MLQTDERSGIVEKEFKVASAAKVASYFNQSPYCSTCPIHNLFHLSMQFVNTIVLLPLQIVLESNFYMKVVVFIQYSVS
jgi:hypothetical protein